MAGHVVGGALDARVIGAPLEISVSPLIDAATVFRVVMPRTYLRLRRSR